MNRKKRNDFHCITGNKQKGKRLPKHIRYHKSFNLSSCIIRSEMIGDRRIL